MTPFQKSKGEKSWPRFAKESSPGKQGVGLVNPARHRAQGYSRTPARHSPGLRLESLGLSPWTQLLVVKAIDERQHVGDGTCNLGSQASPTYTNRGSAHCTSQGLVRKRRAPKS